MQKQNQRWPGKKYQAVVSLSYDDGIENHTTVVAPLLEAYGLRGTFYAPLKSHLMSNPLIWRRMAEKGHEIGNHTVFHPCWSIGGKFSTWLPDEFNLENYTAEQWIDEVKTANQALWLIDGKQERTFGNTCWDNYLGPEDHPTCLEPLIEKIFPAARGVATNRPVNFDPINFNNLGTIHADRRSISDFMPELNQILESGGWIIYTMHGVGIGSHNHYIEENEHLKLVQFLHDHADTIWTAPVMDVVRHLKKN
jgi:peptidoglycan-N-acetylglucosamine deacetylase